MIGMFGDPQLAVGVGGVFGGAAGDLRGRADRSVEAEEQGERATREDSYTDELVDQMRGSISHKLGELSERLSNSGGRVEVEFRGTNLPVSEETRYGGWFILRKRTKWSGVRNPGAAGVPYHSDGDGPPFVLS